ncbi:hypothetical protein VNI00_012708 [Paramarasmius palmivorus]|uniref:F-box domain-containing protein n=1 Tax=Paramarasmius palmivorus TaxID=297713 RepID=A0AAW0C353_9AGAR
MHEAPFNRMVQHSFLICYHILNLTQSPDSASFILSTALDYNLKKQRKSLLHSASSPVDKDYNVSLSPNLSAMNGDRMLTRTAHSNGYHAYIERIANQPIPAHALRSDYVLTEAEAAQTHEMIKDEKELLKEYDEKISWYQDAVDKLKEGRKAAEERLSNRQAMVSGLRRIPVEVWDEIFTLACPTIILGECDTRNYYPFHIPHEGPIQATAHTLSLTCAAWRKIVTSRPRLWSTISFDIYHQCQQTDIRPLVRTYLRYSAKAPLHISIWDARRRCGTFASVRAYHEGLEKKTVDAYRSILRQMHRCASLELQVRWEALSPYVTGMSLISFPRLHIFSHDVSVDDDQDSKSAWFWRAIRRAPNLTYVSEEEGLPGHFNLSPYNQHALTGLRLGGVEDMSHLRDVLASNSRLEIFSACLMWKDRGIPGNIDDLELPFLRYLKITCYWDPMEEWIWLFNSFRIPALVSLYINNELDVYGHDLSDHGQPYYTLPFAVTAPLHRCTTFLQFLTLESDPVSYHESEMTILAQNLPNLTHLRYASFAPIVGISPCTAHLLASLKTAHLKPGLRRHSDIPSPKLKWLEVRELNFRPCFIEELFDDALAVAESRNTRSITTSERAEDVQRLTNIYLWWEYRAEENSDSESDCGSIATDDSEEHESDVELEDLESDCSDAGNGSNSAARAIALEKDGIVCRVLHRVVRQAWFEGFPVTMFH